MSKTKSNELKFSIRSLIDTTTRDSSSRWTPSDVHHSPINLPCKRPAAEPQRPLARRPAPLLHSKTPHPFWPFLTQLSSKTPVGALPVHSPMALLSKVNQVWEQLYRTQVTTAPTDTGDNDVSSDEDTDMETSSVQPDLDGDDDGECSSSGGAEQLQSSFNSEEHDKLKTYPCTHCGKVRRTFA